MAVQVATLDELHKHDTPPQSTHRSGDTHGLQTRVRALVGFWEASAADRAPRKRAQASKEDVAVKELWRPYGDAAHEVGHLPSYEDCLLDLPPDYSTTGLLAQAQCMKSADVATNSVRTRIQATRTSRLLAEAFRVEVDFNAQDGRRECAGKKAKKAAKAAAQSKWAGSDNEGNKDESPTGGDNGQNEGSGGGAGGAGDGEDNNNGGDDGDDWYGGGGKKSKKKSKKKEIEEEEAKQKAEEEEAKLKAEEEAAAAAAAAEAEAEAAPSATADADPVDDWSSFAPAKTKKKKKGAEVAADPPPSTEVAVEDEWSAFATVGAKKKKKGKNALLDIEPEQPKAEEPVDTPAKEEEDPWGSFATVGKGKKSKKAAAAAAAAAEQELVPESEPMPEPPKEAPVVEKITKKKKGKNDSAPEHTKDDAIDMKFDNINLDDDQAAPKLDLDFGLDKKDASNEEKSSSFSFGGWGGGWGSGNTWSFGGSAAGKAEEPEPSAQETKADSGWGFSSKKTSKTSKTSKTKDDNKSSSNTFSFDLGDTAGDVDLDTPAVEEPKPAEEDPWGGYMTAKDRKKAAKKAALAPEPTVLEPVVEATPEEPVKIEEDPWGSFTPAKSKSKSKRKTALSSWDAVETEPVEPPEPDIIPPKVETKVDDDTWGFGMSAKDKKKADKARKRGLLAPEPEPVAAVPEPEPEPVVEPVKEDDGSTKKSKSKKKSTFDCSSEAATEPTAIEVPSPPPAMSDKPANDWLGDEWATKKSKKGKEGAIEELAPPDPPPAEEAAGGEDWFGGSWGTSAKDKKKKSKVVELIGAPPEAPVIELEPEAVVEPTAADDGWANTWSTGTKLKKSSKKGDKGKGIVEVADPSPGASILLPESVQEKSAEDDPWGETSWTTGKKAKSKTKKATAAEPPPPPPPAALPAPPEVNELDLDDGNAGADLLDLHEPAVTEDPWSFTTATSKSKKKKRAKEEPAIVEVPLSKTKSKDSKSSTKAPVEEILDIVEEAVAEPESLKHNQTPQQDDKPSAGWGSSLWGNKKETTKERKAREKREKQEREAAEEAEAARIAEEEAEAQRVADEEAEAARIAEEEAEAQRIAEEAAFAAAMGDDPADLLEDLDVPPPPPLVEEIKKSSKDKKGKNSKLSKVDSKSSKKAEPKEEPVAAIVDVPESDPVISFDEPKKADGWGFWGASLKSSKKATPAAEMSKDPWANDDPVVDDSSKMPDHSSDDVSAMSPPKSAEKVLSKLKGVKGSSVRDSISALEAEPVSDAKLSKSKKDKPPAPPEPETLEEPVPDPIVEVIPEPKSKKSDKKSKKLKEPEPPPPPPISPVPGGFPVDDLLEDVEPEPEMPISPPKKSSKDKKSSTKTAKDSKRKTEPIVEPPTPPADLDELIIEETPEIPTPPPEEKDRPSKKERAKVVRDNKSTSWGFWGATPAKRPSKKESEVKDEATSPKATVRPVGVSRSKSARKTSERDVLDKESKSSASDKGQKESKSRPSTSRGMSFGGLFSTPQPSRSKSTRASNSVAKSSSRRPSTAVEDSGLVSPPPEMSDKAAKLTGVSRSKSSREKKTRMIPDPYPIDSDDMIMVDVPDDSAKDMDDPREKKSNRSKRHQMSGGLGAGDDEAPRGSDEARMFSEPDDIAFVERPAPIRRSSMMKKAGLMGGILGAFGASSRPATERRRSKYDTEVSGASRRKRDAAYDDDGSKRLRREDRKVHRSARKAFDGDGLTDAAPITDVEADEAREARRQERRERRAREEADEAERSARREERRRVKVKEEEDRRLREDEERRARRRARRAEEERLAREENEARAERRERRRQRATDEVPVKSSRPASDRRCSSYMDAAPLEDDEARRIRREERRMRRSVDVGAAASGRDRERPRTSRRQSDYPEDRNGEHTSSHGAIPASFTHAIKTGGDKTSSWVHSVEDAPPPPIEGTIIDAPVHFAADADPDPLDEGETTAREFRHQRARRRERDDAYGLGDDTQRRDGIKSSSGDGSSGRRRSYASPPSYGDMYGGGMRTIDGRPSMPRRSDSKRGSWFKKIAGL